MFGLKSGLRSSHVPSDSHREISIRFIFSVFVFAWSDMCGGESGVFLIFMWVEWISGVNEVTPKMERLNFVKHGVVIGSNGVVCVWVLCAIVSATMSKIGSTKRNQTERSKKNVAQEQTAIPAIKFVNRPRGDIKYLFAKRYIDATVSCRSSSTHTHNRKGTKCAFSERISFMIYEPWGRQYRINCRQSIPLPLWNESSPSYRGAQFIYVVDTHRDEFSMFIACVSYNGREYAQLERLAGTFTSCFYPIFSSLVLCFCTKPR